MNFSGRKSWSFLFFSFLIVILQVFSSADSKDKSFYDFQFNDIDGNAVDMSKFKGMVTLAVNVASQCGGTESNYKSLKRLHDILSYGNKFSVLAFPANNFGEQEPWENLEINEFVKNHFHAEFPLFEKINVIGAEGHEGWKFIAESTREPTWNFHKYLINKNGEVIKDWDNTVSVESIFSYIQNIINEGVDEKDKIKGDFKKEEL